MTAETYARALVSATRGLTAHEITDRVQRFRTILARNGHERMLPRVATLVERILAKQERRERVELVVAREEDRKRFEKGLLEYRGILGAQEGTDITECVDDTVIGGYRLRAKGLMVDATYKRALLELYRVLAVTSR